MQRVEPVSEEELKDEINWTLVNKFCSNCSAEKKVLCDDKTCLVYRHLHTESYRGAASKDKSDEMFRTQNGDGDTLDKAILEVPCTLKDDETALKIDMDDVREAIEKADKENVPRHALRIKLTWPNLSIYGIPVE